MYGGALVVPREPDERHRRRREVVDGPLPVRLQPLDRVDSYITHDGADVRVADPARVETSQFRLVDGLAGKHTTSFAALDAPGSFLRAGPGRVTLAAGDGSAAFAEAASFVRRPGLADAHATSWEALSAHRTFLLHDGAAVRVGAVDDRAAATWVLQ